MVGRTCHSIILNPLAWVFGEGDRGLRVVDLLVFTLKVIHSRKDKTRAVPSHWYAREAMEVEITLLLPKEARMLQYAKHESYASFEWQLSLTIDKQNADKTISFTAHLITTQLYQKVNTKHLYL